MKFKVSSLRFKVGAFWTIAAGLAIADLAAGQPMTRNPNFTMNAASSVYGNGTTVYGGGTTNAHSLYNSLLAYYTFDNGGSLGADSTSDAYNLTPSGSPASVAGVVNNAASVTGSAGFSRADQVNFRIDGSTSFTVAGWYYVPAGAGTIQLFNKLVNAYALTYNASGLDTIVKFTVYNTASTPFAASIAVLPLNQWNYVVAWYDQPSATVNIQMNNGTVVSTGITGTPGTAGGGADSTFLLNYSASTEKYDEMGIWARTLTTAERTRLYNGGSGLGYASF